MTTLLRKWEEAKTIHKIIGVSSGLVILGALFLFIFVGIPNNVEIHADGEVLNLRTWDKTVAQVLEKSEIILQPADVTIPSLDTPIEKGALIQVIRAFPVSILVGEEKIDIQTTPSTVEEVLKANQIALGEHDLVSPSLRDYLTPEENIVEIVRVSHERVTKDIKVSFTTQYMDDNNAVQGINRTVQQGKEGLKQQEYKITYHNGIEVERELVAEKEVRKAVSRIIAKGTQPKVMVASRGNDSFRYRQVISMESTAYTHTGNRTSTGIYPYVGVVAVDPKVIPLGTRVYVDGYGHALAADIGSAIKGNKIDVFLETRAEARRWGRKTVKVYVLE